MGEDQEVTAVYLDRQELTLRPCLIVKRDEGLVFFQWPTCRSPNGCTIAVVSRDDVFETWDAAVVALEAWRQECGGKANDSDWGSSEDSPYVVPAKDIPKAIVNADGSVSYPAVIWVEI